MPRVKNQMPETDTQFHHQDNLFRRRRILGDSLGALRDGVLGQLTRQDQANRGLDLSGRDGRLLVVSGKLRGLRGDTLEDI